MLVLNHTCTISLLSKFLMTWVNYVCLKSVDMMFSLPFLPFLSLVLCRILKLKTQTLYILIEIKTQLHVEERVFRFSKHSFGAPAPTPSLPPIGLVKPVKLYLHA